MERYDEWKQLEKFGLYGLTGEEDGLSIRYLVDLNEEGVQLMEQVLKVQIDRTRDTSRNHRNGCIKSMLIPYEWLYTLLIFAAFKDGYDVVIRWYSYEGNGFREYDCVCGYTQEEFDKMNFNDVKRHYRIIRKSTAPGNGFINMHMFSGRIGDE